MTRSLKATKSQAKPTLGEFTETEAGVYQSVFTTGTQSGEATITVSVDGMSKTVTAELRATMMDVANSTLSANEPSGDVNRPGFPGECFICELRLPDHRFRWKHNKLFLLLPEEYGPAFPAIVDCYTSPPTLVWPVPLLHGFSSSYGVLPPLCKDH